MGPECPEHGAVPHHTVSCNRKRSAMQAVLKLKRRDRYIKLGERPEHFAALARGEIIYWAPLCLNGYAGRRADRSPRYTRSTQCVACAQNRPRAKSAVEIARDTVVDVASKRQKSTLAASSEGDRARRILSRITQGLRRLGDDTR